MSQSVILLVLCILVLIGVAYGYYCYSPAPQLQPLGAKIRQSTVRVGGGVRSYLIYIPANLPQQSALVIVLLGSGMDGARMRLCTGYEFDCLADRHGFVVLYPDGYRGNWKDCRKYAPFPAKRENIDDMRFIRTLIARTSQEHAIDEKQVKLLKAGKVRAIGASNYNVEQLGAALKVAEDNHLPSYQVLQREYNLYNRTPYDGSLRELCINKDLGVVTYYSLASGFLSGKYRSSVDLGKSKRGEGVAKYLNERGLNILKALDTVAAQHQARPAEIALAWLIARNGVTAPIASATSIAQVENFAKAATLRLLEPFMLRSEVLSISAHSGLAL
jgi:hypothetical protein